MIVQVKQGKLKGIQNTSVLTGKPFYSFSGIPYAKPPTGNLRFQPPEPAESWDGIRDASQEGNDCAQWNPYVGKEEFSGSEDCLYLNVHTPEQPSEIITKKAVMVFIHGGAFMVGSGSSKEFYAPDFLMNYDIIYVAINYRLHVLGFLDMGIQSCPGNAGMKDQVLALKWIKENISNFGGDPDNITIFGESAGGAFVHLHMLSPASKGVFNKAIAQSGNGLCPWSITQNPTERGFLLGQRLGFQDKDPEKLVEFLKEKSVDELVKAFKALQENTKEFPRKSTQHILFTPTVEVIKEHAFLPDMPENLINSAEPVPFLTGFCDMEGSVIFFVHDPNSIATFLSDYSRVIQNIFDFSETEIPSVIKKVEEFYSGSEGGKPGTVKQLIDLHTDLYFMKFYKSFDYIAQSDVPVYVYEFTFEGGLNFYKKLTSENTYQHDLPAGAAHGDEMGYLFHSELFNKEREFADSDRKMIDKMCSLWTNFAKTNNPTKGQTNVEWLPTAPEKPCYLKIGEDLQLIPGNVEERRFMFWKNLLGNTKYKF